MLNKVNEGDGKNKQNKYIVWKIFFLSPEINFFFWKVFLSPEINCFFRKSVTIQYNARAGQKKIHVFW